VDDIHDCAAHIRPLKVGPTTLPRG
jgi:hypothetical protein